jgi:hypothetical protein
MNGHSLTATQLYFENSHDFLQENYQYVLLLNMTDCSSSEALCVYSEVSRDFLQLQLPIMCITVIRCECKEHPCKALPFIQMFLCFSKSNYSKNLISTASFWGFLSYPEVSRDVLPYGLSVLVQHRQVFITTAFKVFCVVFRISSSVITST